MVKERKGVLRVNLITSLLNAQDACIKNSFQMKFGVPMSSGINSRACPQKRAPKWLSPSVKMLSVSLTVTDQKGLNEGKSK